MRQKIPVIIETYAQKEKALEIPGKQKKNIKAAVQPQGKHWWRNLRGMSGGPGQCVLAFGMRFSEVLSGWPRMTFPSPGGVCHSFCGEWQLQTYDPEHVFFWTFWFFKGMDYNTEKSKCEKQPWNK